MILFRNFKWQFISFIIIINKNHKLSKLENAELIVCMLFYKLMTYYITISSFHILYNFIYKFFKILNNNNYQVEFNNNLVIHILVLTILLEL